MILYNHMAVFAEVVSKGSFTQAAESLDMPKSTVSLKVTQLEEQLGVKLLQRTTRKIALTEQGASFFKHSQRMLQHATSAIEDAQGKQAEPWGKLKISAPASIAADNDQLAEVIHRYIQRYPLVNIELVTSNAWVDLIKEGFDVALRAGPLQDSSLIARELVTINRYLMASPDYLARHGTPKSLQELISHQCLVSKHAANWQFVSAKGLRTVPLTKTVEANDLTVIKQLTLKGAGIAIIHDSQLTDEIETGQLIKLPACFTLQPRNLSLVYPSRELQSVNLRRFIEVVLEVYQG